MSLPCRDLRREEAVGERQGGWVRPPAERGVGNEGDARLRHTALLATGRAEGAPVDHPAPQPSWDSFSSIRNNPSAISVYVTIRSMQPGA